MIWLRALAVWLAIFAAEAAHAVARLAKDFNPTRGGLLGLGLLVLFLAPGWMARLRGLPVAGGWR